MSYRDVLVVGAGPAGLTLACDLKRRGLDVEIVEKLSAPSPASKGKALQPRTLEVFHDLGILPEVLSCGGAYPPLGFYAEGRIVKELTMMTERAPTEEVPYPNPVMIPQWKTEDILRNRLQGLGGSVRFGCELVGFSQLAQGVSADLLGPSGTETVKARFLVGADGGRSAVRNLSGLRLEGDNPEIEGLLIGDVCVDGLSRDHWHVWGASLREFVGLCPLPSTDSFQFTATLKPGDDPEPSLEALQAALDARAFEHAPKLKSQSWLSKWRPNIRMAERFRNGRVFIIGDAAHIHTPAGGQGLNTSVQDAYNLAWKLAAALETQSDELLDTYEEERLPVAAALLGRSEMLYRRGLNGDQVALQRADDEHQLLLNYGAGSLSKGQSVEGVLRPGDRMPNAWLKNRHGDPVNLFDVMQGKDGLAIFIDTPPTPEPLSCHGQYCRNISVSSLSDNTENVDYVSIGKLIGQLAGHTIIIRPDGYVSSIHKNGVIDSSGISIP